MIEPEQFTRRVVPMRRLGIKDVEIFQEALEDEIFPYQEGCIIQKSPHVSDRLELLQEILSHHQWPFGLFPDRYRKRFHNLHSLFHPSDWQDTSQDPF